MSTATLAAPADRADVAVIGAGILGLATAYQLRARRPDLRIVVVEREPEVAAHQSGHNSGVLHAGIYYPPGSLKARLCVEGKAEMEAFADAHGIPRLVCGKLVVAIDESELPRLETIRQRGEASGVPGLEAVGPERLREIEPAAAGIRAVWSPRTGIIDYRQVTIALARDLAAQEVVLETSRLVHRIERTPRGFILRTPHGDLVARRVITCAGLWSDRMASMTGDGGAERIVPFRGDYYTLRPEARSLVQGLIYPVPDPRFPFLGVHFTRRIDGEVWAGPNAVLAMARAGYRRRDLNVRDLVSALTDRGFLRLARRHWRTGAAEMWRDIWKPAFMADLRRLVPAVQSDQLTFGPSGVRAQAIDPDGSLVEDFRFGGSQGILHVRNAPSPAATASLAIGRVVAETAIQQFDLAPGFS